MKIRTVVSLFNGMSCGRLALAYSLIPVEKYSYSEIDKYANMVTEHHWPHDVALGDVTKWREWDINWAEVDLFMGGSPCQGFSAAGKQGGTKAILGGEEIIVSDRETYLDMKDKGAEFLSQSYLFWEYILCLDHVKLANPDVQFLLENVKMSKPNMNMITEAIGVDPMLINSALVSAQNRQRWYWFNWEVDQPEDRGILLKDVLEDGDKVGRIVGRKINPETGKRDDYNGDLKIKQRLEPRPDEKCGCLTTVQKDNVVVRPCKLKEYDKAALCHHVADATDINDHDCLKRVYSETGKSPTLNACTGGNREPKLLVNESATRDNAVVGYDLSEKANKRCVENPRSRAFVVGQEKSGALLANQYKQSTDSLFQIIGDGKYRKLTPLECERLQTAPDDYTLIPKNDGTQIVSNSQRYKIIGNGWTVEVISHILNGLTEVK